MADEINRKTDLSALRIDRNNPNEPIGTKRVTKITLWIGLPLIALVLIWIISGGISPAVEVRVGTVTTLTQVQAQSILSATGYVVAQHKAAVASKGTGRLEYLGVEEGDKVAKGAIIGRLENDDMSAALELAKANLEQARANSTEATLRYNRITELYKGGSSTKADYENAQAMFAGSTAAVKSAQAAVRSAEVSFENTYIRAPFNGTVLTKYADVGEIVAPFGASGNTRGAVVDLADMSSLEAEADVSEANIHRVNVGQPCEIILDAYPDIHYKGQVKKIVPTADRTRATVMTKVTFDQLDERVLPEMSARINFLESDTTSNALDTGAMAVSNAALSTRNGRQVIFAIENNKARMIDVTTGRKLGNLTEISGPINAGQKVVMSPPSSLKSGDKVKTAE